MNIGINYSYSRGEEVNRPLSRTVFVSTPVFSTKLARTLPIVNSHDFILSPWQRCSVMNRLSSYLIKQKGVDPLEEAGY